MAIELLGTVVVSNDDDLWKHYMSIDCAVERYVIVNNSEGRFPEVENTLGAILNGCNPFIEETVIINNRLNAGFGGAVNQIIKQNFDCNYWFITNDDWHAAPGELTRLAERLEDDFVGLLCDGTDANGYSAFVMSNEMVSKVGLMDENFYPAYCEDNDHRYRVKLAGLAWDKFPIKASHKVSSTLHNNTQFEERNQFTFRRNVEYYIEKWGGDRGQEKYVSPFGSGAPLDYWPYRPDRIYEQTWM